MLNCLIWNRFEIHQSIFYQTENSIKELSYHCKIVKKKLKTSIWWFIIVWKIALFFTSHRNFIFCSIRAELPVSCSVEMKRSCSASTRTLEPSSDIWRSKRCSYYKSLFEFPLIFGRALPSTWRAGWGASGLLGLFADILIASPTKN